MKKILLAIVIVAVLVILVAGGFFIYGKFFVEDSPEGVSTGKSVSIPKKILDNKFGFLSGGPEGELEMIKEMGALWGRPHPGPFLWDRMQESENDKISFSDTDDLVEQYQEDGVGLLITLWPFADWDQERHDNAEQLKVSENDEFLPRKDDPFGAPDYIS